MTQQADNVRGRALVVCLAAGLAVWGMVLAGPSSAEPQPRAEKKGAEPVVTAVPEAVVKRFKLDTTFYKKHVDYKGFSILGSAKVSDAALLEARYLIDQLWQEWVFAIPGTSRPLKNCPAPSVPCCSTLLLLLLESPRMGRSRAQPSCVSFVSRH